MKKGKVIKKNQVLVLLMVAGLGAAVWLNIKFSSSEKYLGEAKYVSNPSSNAVQTSAKANETTTSDYFATAKKDRQKAIEKAQDIIKETLNSDKLSEEDKSNAVLKAEALANRTVQSQNIESLLKAKGFEKAVAVIGDENINVIVKSDGLTTAQTLQIQDIVTSETSIPLGNIKIVTVK